MAGSRFAAGLPQGVIERRDVDLRPFTTFGVRATARHFYDLTDADALPGLLRSLQTADVPLVLGGGSNILFTGDVERPIIRIANRGCRIRDAGDGTARLAVAAGENWDAFVRRSLNDGFCGLENLILIPGTVGAAPIQNIGAYGVEVGRFVEQVKAWDRKDARFVTLSRAECRFAYRDSIFKHRRDRYIVTEVDFTLPVGAAPLQLDYAGLRQELEAMQVARPDAKDVAAAVERLRRRKLPDPGQIGNAGSFFKNPVVIESKALELQRYHPELPVFELDDGNSKLSAAWLIEQCGFKGAREGDVGVSDRHALVLVNHGNATGAQVWALAMEIREAVEERFGVRLEPEPLIL